MSSPPALDFPSSDLDVPMEDGTAEESMPNAPPAQPLFFAGTPSVAATSVAGTPRRDGVVARRALGMTTPKRTPLFNGELFLLQC
jgi:DNA replication licensing factor MCM4